MKIYLSNYETKLEEDGRQFIVIADQPKISPQLVDAIIGSVMKMVQKSPDADSRKVEDLMNLLVIIKNNTKGI